MLRSLPLGHFSATMTFHVSFSAIIILLFSSRQKGWFPVHFQTTTQIKLNYLTAQKQLWSFSVKQPASGLCWEALTKQLFNHIPFRPATTSFWFFYSRAPKRPAYDPKGGDRHTMKLKALPWKTTNHNRHLYGRCRSICSALKAPIQKTVWQDVWLSGPMLAHFPTEDVGREQLVAMWRC